MEKQKSKFVEEINTLLSNYIHEDELNSFIANFEVNQTCNPTLKDVINKFYAQQLNIDYNLSYERMQIDRIITFSQKKFSKEKLSEILLKLALLCVAQGKLNLAIEILNKILKQSQDEIVTADASFLLADVYSRRAEWQNAIYALETANKLYLKNCNYIGYAKCQNMFGVICGEKGDILEAKFHFEECLNILKNNHDKELEAQAKSNLGILFNIQGDYEKAADNLMDALRYFESTGDFRRIAELRQNLGVMYHHKKEYQKSLTEIDISIEIALAHRLMSILEISYLSKADVLLDLEDYSSALAFTNKALEISHLIGDKLSIAEVYKAKGKIERVMKNFARAENYLKSSSHLNTIAGNKMNLTETQTEVCKLYSDMLQGS